MTAKTIDRKVPKQLREKIIQEYEKGASVRTLADRYKFNHDKFAPVLESWGVVLRPKGQRIVVRTKLRIVVPKLGSCHEWQGYCQNDGYGVLGRNGTTMLAHRAYWEDAHGAIPDDKNVLHSCDNPPCVRVEHLYLGDQKKNAQDRLDRGQRGFKLNYELADEIRARYASGELQVVLAAHYGVSQTQISRIVRNHRWVRQPETVRL